MHVTHQYSTYGGNDECVKILDVTPYGRDLCSGLTREDRLQSRGETSYETPGKNKGLSYSVFLLRFS